MFIVYFKKIPTYITKMFKCILKQFSVYQTNVQFRFENCSAYIPKIFNVYLRNVHRIVQKCSMHIKKCSMVEMFLFFWICHSI